MGSYTIRELENLSGIKAHTIRIWEKRYGLITPQRTSTNIRTYQDTELKKLLNISILNRNGLKISKIARLSVDEINAKINQYAQDLTSTESQIENLTLAMIDLDEYRFEQILARSVIKFGFEETVLRILFPFFVRIGLMWQMDSINTTQEHFVSNLIRQKFFSAIDNLEYNPKNQKPGFVFFLPDGEYYDISLLFFCYFTQQYFDYIRVSF
jgi:DNA-binding transcriptional MerR regulator